MPWAVLIRGANVGGKTFRPSQMAEALPELGLVSIGAAGTFAAQSGRSAEKVRAAIAAALPFPAEVMVLPGEKLHELVSSAPLDHLVAGPGVRRFLTVAARDLPANAPPLPHSVPAGAEWEVQLVTIRGPFVAGLSRRGRPRSLYPNQVIEKMFKVPATTRWWETVEALDRTLGPH